MRRMKRIFVFLVASMVLALTACEQEAGSITSVSDADRSIRVSMGEGLTRAGYATSNLTDFGFFVDTYGVPEFTYNNVRMVKGEDGEWNPENNLQMQWMFIDGTYDILAYAPYQKDETYTATSQVPVNVKEDQSTEENLIASDFIAMKWAGYIPYKDSQFGRVPVQMKHLMSRIKMRIRYNEVLRNDDGTNPISEISIVGACLNGVCDFSLNPLTVTAVQPQGETPSVILFRTGDYPEECYATYECILVPQTIQPSINLVLEDGLLYIYNHSNKMKLEPGHSYNMNFRLEKHMISFEKVVNN